MPTKLNFPEFEFRIKEEGKRTYIFDSIRKKYLVLTPEEWVRQNLIHYLVQVLGYPAGLMQLEKKVMVNGLSRRLDLAVMNTSQRIILLAECKASHIELSAETVYQAAAYGKMLNPKIYLLSNGLRHICFSIGEKGPEFLEAIPSYPEIC